MIELPKYQPLPLRTKGQPWYTRTVRMFQRRAYLIIEDYYYEDQYGMIRMIPKGFCTDFASSPRLFWILGLDPKGILLVPALFHDFGYRHDFYLDKNGDKVMVGVGRRFHDWKMKQDILHVNGMCVPALASWGTLRIGGWLAWENKAKYRDGELHLIGPYGNLLPTD